MILKINEAKNEEGIFELEPTCINQTWESNHTLITKAIAKLIRQNERLPSKTEIAEATGLSRQTVHKHIKQFGQEALVVEALKQYKFMSSKVLAKIIELAMDGDVKAARLSLEVMGIINSQNGNKPPS
jgi:biotin operon repressor